MRIEACFDSHVHWPSAGEFFQRLRLAHLQSPEEIKNVKSTPQHKRGEWLLGFGWDDTRWPRKPHRTLLDQWYPEGPVALLRCDGHALWVNTEVLKRAGLWDDSARIVAGGRITEIKTGQGH